ncbi:hypothetical protein GCM10010313_24070 [Streptomyces violarus]|uniref:Uncharacterized protein n=1 Tax=Streptomyces violarus TaxID=67380 RepID=A0A7W5F3L7_9ACTN|nr:hypothetical protein [Streptomyces violarus]GHD06217.1 hypothetical protein GCM10010313_24070 [Streptomyces violarus]
MSRTTSQGVRRVVGRSVDLGQAAEAVRVLETVQRWGRTIGRADQLPHTAGDVGVSAVRTGGVDGGGVGLVRTVGGQQRQRGDDLGGLQQPAQLVQGEGRLATKNSA